MEVHFVDKNAFLIDLSESTRTDFGRINFEKQSEAHKVFSAIWELESQVNNGGFRQYFWNSDSDIISFAPVALNAIGATVCANIVERAIGIISPVPPTEDERRAVVDALDASEREDLESLNGEFFEYPD